MRHSGRSADTRPVFAEIAPTRGRAAAPAAPAFRDPWSGFPVAKTAPTTVEGGSGAPGNALPGPVGPGAVSAGAALFARLKAVGVDYVFANSGTDFPPIIEGLAEAAASGVALPDSVVTPHEHAALGMAHGYFLQTGRAQAVMLHTNVGLANGAIGTINAATSQAPMILMSGRTPTTEKGRFGARTVPIGWGQEMRDQAAMVRECCKWDYELRFPEQVPELIDRAHAIANSTPKGPVYLSLPREVLCEPCPTQGLRAPPSMAAAVAAPDTERIDRAARLLAQASAPVIFAQRGAGSAAGFAALSRLARDWAIPVCQYWAVQTAVPTDHEMAVGADPEPWLSEADVVLVVDSLAPWAPHEHAPRAAATVVQLGPDPLFSSVPVRNFRSDLSIGCETALGIEALERALRPMLSGNDRLRDERRSRVDKRVAQIRRLAERATEPCPGINKAYVSKVLSKAISGRDATVLSELGCPLDQLVLDRHNSWHQEPHSGGLGWSFPCALGMQLAAPDRLIVATMGDGSYIFANPVACHQIAEAMRLPVLVVVLNNSGWEAVRRSVLGLYPHGFAARTNRMPLTDIMPSPDFTRVAAASRGHAVRVKRPERLAAALADAIAHIDETRTQALVDVAIR